jgi:hypothetical protein
MTDKNKKRILAAVLVAVALFLLWNMRDKIIALFNRPKMVPETVTMTGQDKELADIPGLVFPDFNFDIPPLSYNPSPYMPVQYNPAPMQGLGLGNCSLCGDYGDATLVIPTPNTAAPVPVASPQTIAYAQNLVATASFSGGGAARTNYNNVTGRSF